MIAAVAVAAALGGAPVLYVTNEDSGDVTIVDTAADAAVATIAVGSRPRGVQVSADGRHVYVALSDMESRTENDGDGIVEIDARTRRVVRRWPAGTDPEQLAVAPDRSRLYAANEDAGTASITDLASGSVLATLVVGIEPEGVGVSPDGRFVYVTAETSNTVSVIDTREQAVVATFLVDARPRALAFAPDGRHAWVTAEIGGTVSMVETAGHSVVDAVELPGDAKPVGVVVGPDGRVWVANGHAHSVAVIDPAARRVTAEIPVGRRPWGIAITPDGRKVYTANGLSNDVSVVDTARGAVVATIPVGERPWGVAIGASPEAE